MRRRQATRASRGRSRRQHAKSGLATRRADDRVRAAGHAEAALPDRGPEWRSARGYLGNAGVVWGGTR